MAVLPFSVLEGGTCGLTEGQQGFPAELGELTEKTFKCFVFDDNPLVDKNRLSKILSKVIPSWPLPPFT